MLDFNLSHNDVVSVPLSFLPLDLLKMKEWIVDGCNLYVYFLTT